MSFLEFWLWLVGMLVIVTALAGIADLLGWMFPDWQAEAEESLEDEPTTIGSGS